MTKRARRNHTPAFKAKVALAAVEGRQDAGRTGAALRCASEPDHGLEGATARGGGGSFRRRPSNAQGAAPVDLKALHAKIGELALENDFLEGALIKAGMLSAKR